MKFTTMLAMMAASAALTLTGCRVEQTKEGEVEMPAYDVDAADVDMGTTKTEVTVPTVDVNMPPENTATPAPAGATPIPSE